MLVAFIGRSARAEDMGKESKKTRVLAEVDGEKITAEELDRSLSALLYRAEMQLFHIRSQKLDTLIAQRLLSKEAVRRKISVEELLEKEITSKTEKVTDEEIETIYHQNKARLEGDEDEAKEQVRTYLHNQKVQRAREQFVVSLKTGSKISVYLKEPEPPIVNDIQLEGAPTKGPEQALVTIVEFVDYQ